MNIVKRTWNKVFGSLTKFEKIWLAIFSVVILATTIVFSVMGTDYSSFKSIALNWIVSPVSALTGVICVLLVARTSIYNYSFGLIQSITYGLIAWVAGYYGDWILNWFFFVPTQFLIFYFWRKNLKPKSIDLVKVKKFTLLQALLVMGGGVVAFVAFGFALHYVDFWFINFMKRSASIYANITTAFGIPLLGPMMDSSTEILQIVAQILMIKRMAEQWPLWIATNVITIVMWGAVLVTDPTSISWVLPTLIMWIAFLVNSIYGTKVWYREANR
jgi:nicotinamide mononucleotide transporter